VRTRVLRTEKEVNNGRKRVLKRRKKKTIQGLTPKKFFPLDLRMILFQVRYTFDLPPPHVITPESSIEAFATYFG
jgi:hypothetical protein